MIKTNIGVALLVASALVMGCSSSDDDATPPATDAGTTDTGTTDTGTTDTGTTDTGTTDTGTTDTGTTDTGTTDTGTTDTGTTDTGTTDTGTTDTGTTDTGTTDTGTTDGGLSYNANSIMGVMAADARLTTIAGAMNPNFDQSLDTADQNWTVFAPTNEAVAAAIAGGAEVTGPVLQSHIYTQGAVASTDLVAGQTVSMSNNSVYTITAADGGGLLINGIAIIEADLAVDNGALHVIDGVLIPNN